MDEKFQELQNLYCELKKTQFLHRKNYLNNTDQDQPYNVRFQSLMECLNNILTTITLKDDLYIKILTMKSSLYYEQSKMLMLTENLNISKEALQNALDVIKDYHSHDQVTFLYMRLINHLAYLFSKDGNYEESSTLLEGVTDYDDPKDMLIYNTDELFFNQTLKKDEAKLKFNKLIANNLQMLAWIYGKFGRTDMHAAKQHLALRKQLEANDFEPIGWVYRCIKLASVYLAGSNWKSACYHLVASGAMLSRLEKDITDSSELAHAWADLSRAWISYGLNLFGSSKLYFADRKYPGYFETGETKNFRKTLEENKVADFSFPGLEINTSDIPSELIKSSAEARNLFLHTYEWLKRTKIHYNLRDYPIEYVNTVLDLSELLRLLAFYEPDLDSQYNVQKRRADALETLSSILREVRPQSYATVSVELLRELSEVQIEMMGINLRRLHTEKLADDGMDVGSNLKRRISAISRIQHKLSSFDPETSKHVEEDQDSVSVSKSSTGDPEGSSDEKVINDKTFDN